MDKDSFLQRAWNGVFFACFIKFFASLSARLDFKQGKINKIRILHSTLVVETGLKSESFTPILQQEIVSKTVTVFFAIKI